MKTVLFSVVLILMLTGCIVPIENPAVSSERYVPPAGTTWHWQLQGEVDLEYPVDLYSIDLFDTPQSTIDALHDRGVKVICYFSAGSYEPWRSDAHAFEEIDLQTPIIGSKVSGWDENWLDVRRYTEFAPIMEARFDLASEKGCDGIEPDLIHAYSEGQGETGFSITKSEQLAYNRWLASQAHERGMSIALKYGIDMAADLVDEYDFVINEQCFQYDECDEFSVFIDANKAVLGVEYIEEMTRTRFAQVCPEANAAGYSWMLMNYDLDGRVREPCW